SEIMKQKINDARLNLNKYKKKPEVQIFDFIPDNLDVLELEENSSSAELMKARAELHLCLTKIGPSDLIIVAPNVTEMKDIWVYSLFLEHAKYKLLVIAENDYYPERPPCLRMGLGKESLGVLIPKT